MAGTQATEQAAQEASFKEQLDRVSDEKRQAEAQKNQPPNPIVEKITEYVPAASKILGSSKQPEEGTKSEDIPGPPERPHHDHKIEDFVRDQHRSKVEDGSIKLDGNGGS